MGNTQGCKNTGKSGKHGQQEEFKKSFPGSALLMMSSPFETNYLPELCSYQRVLPVDCCAVVMTEIHQQLDLSAEAGVAPLPLITSENSTSLEGDIACHRRHECHKPFTVAGYLTNSDFLH
ncbi:MAG: hypothetical protein MZU84_07140 [Sphingobacterium sp.]|nr:hypothetical protein [Sphingobacterium sp.]